MSKDNTGSDHSLTCCKFIKRVGYRVVCAELFLLSKFLIQNTELIITYCNIIYTH